MGTVESKGVQIEVEGKWASGIEARASYDVQKSTDKDTEVTLANSPQHIGKLNLFIPLSGGNSPWVWKCSTQAYEKPIREELPAASGSPI